MSYTALPTPGPLPERLAPETRSRFMPRAVPNFDTLYRAHAPSVFRRARQLLQCDAEASEVVQDLFLSLYQRPDQFSGKSSLTTWLYSATTHACLNRLRNQRNRARLINENLSRADRDHAPGADVLSALRRVLRSLPEPLGQVAVYYYFDELTHDEIAGVIGCSRRHVGNLIERLHRTLEDRENV